MGYHNHQLSQVLCLVITLSVCGEAHTGVRPANLSETRRSGASKLIGCKVDEPLRPGYDRETAHPTNKENI